MENQLESGYQGMILQVPRNHWSLFFNGKKRCIWGKIYHGYIFINAFIQISIPPKKYGEERVILKITGVIVDMLVELESEIYIKHVVF